MPSSPAGQTPRSEVERPLSATPGWVADPVVRLEDHALVWESASGLRPLTVVSELLGRVPDPGEGPVDVPPAAVTTAHDLRRPAGPPPAPPSTPYAGSSCCWTTGVGSRGGCSGRGRGGPRPPGRGGPAARRRPDRRLRGRAGREAGLLAPGAPGTAGELAAHRCVRRWCRGRPPSGGPTSPEPGWPARAPPATSAPATRPASRSTRCPPGLVDPHLVDTRWVSLAAGGRPPRGPGARLRHRRPSLVARVRWLRPRRPRVQGPLVAGRSRRRRCSGSPGWAR